MDMCLNLLGNAYVLKVAKGISAKGTEAKHGIITVCTNSNLLLLVVALNRCNYFTTMASNAMGYALQSACFSDRVRVNFGI